jgi:DNA invertase Pin-like site-specific DNA recombinase
MTAPVTSNHQLSSLIAGRRPDMTPPFSIIARLDDKHVAFRCLQQGGVDTDSSTGRLTLAILGAVAAFETDIRRERQLEGIERAKAAGVYKGRRPSIDRAQVRSLHQAGVGASEIAKRHKIGRASVYRALSGEK